VRQRDQRNQGDQQIRPPFQENYVEDFIEQSEDQIHLFYEDDSKVYLTKEEHDRFLQEQDNALLMDSEEYRQGYQNVIFEFQKQYNLRNKNVVVNPNKVQVDQPSTSQKKKDPPRKDMPEKDNPKDDAPKKSQDGKKDVNIKEVEKSQSPFNLESEISKLKVSIPFNELIKNTEYRGQIMKMLKMGETYDTLNIHDDHPTFLFGPRVEADNDNDEVPPFYISLNFHDMTLHNAMLDSGASHNLMPKVVMENLGLDITRTI
jgi:hypothetical protein